MKRLIIWSLAVVVVALPTVVHAGEGDVTVVVSPATASFDLGADIELTVAVTNNSDTEMTDLAVHIDITDPTKDGSVGSGRLGSDIDAAHPQSGAGPKREYCSGGSSRSREGSSRSTQSSYRPDQASSTPPKLPYTPSLHVER